VKTCHGSIFPNGRGSRVGGLDHYPIAGICRKGEKGRGGNLNLLTVEVLSFKEVLERFTKMTQEDSFRLVPVSLLPEHAKGQLNEC
jgi:hypothetical protein